MYNLDFNLCFALLHLLMCFRALSCAFVCALHSFKLELVPTCFLCCLLALGALLHLAVSDIGIGRV